MSNFQDANKVFWDIRTTSVQVDDKTANAQWFATPTPGGNLDYSGNQFPVVDEDETIASRAIVLTWPANGNPIIRGKGSDKDAEDVIKAFVARGLKQQLAVVVRASADAQPPSLLALIALAVLVYYADR